jgi:hypothetical protein
MDGKLHTQLKSSSVEHVGTVEGTLINTAQFGKFTDDQLLGSSPILERFSGPAKDRFGFGPANDDGISFIHPPRKHQAPVGCCSSIPAFGLHPTPMYRTQLWVDPQAPVQLFTVPTAAREV